MWKPLLAGAILIAIAVAIIAPTLYAVDPWLNVWMLLCRGSAWSDFKPCLARHGVQVDDLGFGFILLLLVKSRTTFSRRHETVRMAFPVKSSDTWSHVVTDQVDASRSFSVGRR